MPLWFLPLLFLVIEPTLKLIHRHYRSSGVGCFCHGSIFGGSKFTSLSWPSIAPVRNSCCWDMHEQLFVPSWKLNLIHTGWAHGYTHVAVLGNKHLIGFVVLVIVIWVCGYCILWCGFEQVYLHCHKSNEYEYAYMLKDWKSFWYLFSGEDFPVNMNRFVKLRHARLTNVDAACCFLQMFWTGWKQQHVSCFWFHQRPSP